MNNADYWRGRFSILSDSAHRKANRSISDLEQMFVEAEHSVQAEIEKWYGRFAVNNQISMAEARKMLTTGQLEEFKWTVEKYIQVGQTANLSPEWLRKLENASTRFHVSRLEAIQTQIQQQIEVLYGGQTDSIDKLLRDIAGNGYTRTAFEIQKGIGLGWDITALNPKRLDTLLSTPWTADNRTFRDRCWTGKAQLVQNVQKALTQGMLRGDGSQKITDAVKKQFNVSRYQAGRLVHTETTYFNAIASKECYRDLGVDAVEVIETLDSHTCDICQPLDGAIVPMAEYEPGVTVPPFHPNCRGTTAPAINPNILGERAARKSDDQPTYYVPSNMKYADWEKTFVQGGTKDGLTLGAVGGIINVMEVQNVTNEYRRSATPGKGTITYDDGYKTGVHREEIETAEWLHNTFGGNIRVLNDRGYVGVSPDYEWNGKLWELKGPSTATSTDNAVKKALKQIYENSGGIILDYHGHEITAEVLAVVKRRIERSALPQVDVIFLKNKELFSVLRYKNEGR